MPQEIHRDYVDGDDPCRLVLDYSDTACSRQKLMEILDFHQVDVELIDARRMVCIPALDTPRSSFNALAEACREIAQVEAGGQSQTAADLAQRKAFLRQEGSSFKIRENFFAESEEIEFQDALGRRSAAMIAPYPPGVPLLWPGEEITEADISLWQELLSLAYDIRGLKSGKVEVLAEE